MIEISAVLGSTQSLLQLLRAGLAARDDAKVRAALTQLEEKLRDATSVALAHVEQAAKLQAALHVAQRENRELEVRLVDRAHYDLTELRPGAFAYAFKPLDDRPHVPKHHVCQPCYDKGIKSVLRFVPGNDWVHGKWTCPAADQHTIEDTDGRAAEPLRLHRASPR